MSGTVDTRTVEMRFDNSDFESNVKQSMSTLERLKAALKLDGASAGLKEIEKTSEKLDFKDLNKNIDGVGKHFNALETIATGALLKIGASAAETGIKIAKSLTIDQVASGWNKYAEKTTAVQTIMANIRDEEGEFIDEASKLDHVNRYLNKLLWFSDETSYSFTDMTSNVGKFIANGQGLEDSVTAMQGIATWAAISGQNSQVAARAMYNISQALGTGSMKIKDWMSIENANMATAQFKELAITVGQKKGKIKQGQVTIENFRESLSGKDTNGWFDKEVMMEVFETYGEAADRIQEYAEAHSVTSTEAIREIKKTDKEFADSLGFKAFAAAQEAKTFGEVVSATADAVSTKWMRIFENIFGDYLQAKELWTDLSEDMWNLFAGPLDSMNEIMTMWNEGFVENSPQSVLNRWLSSDKLGKIGNALDYVAYSTTDLANKSGSATYRIETLADGTQRLVRMVETAPGVYTKFTEKIYDADKELLSGRDLLIDGFRNILRTFVFDWEETNKAGKTIEHKSIFTTIKDGLKEVIFGTSDMEKIIPKAAKKLWEMTKRFNEFSKKLLPTESTLGKIKNAFKGLFTLFKIGGNLVKSIAKPFVNLFKNVFKGAPKTILDLADSIGTWIQKLDQWLDKNKIFDKVSQKVTSGLDKMKKALNDLSVSITGKTLGELGEDLKNKVFGFFENFDFQEKFDRVSAFFGGIAEQIRQVKTGDLPETLTPFQKFLIVGKKVFNKLKAFFVFLGSIFSSVWTSVKSLFKTGDFSAFFSEIGLAFSNIATKLENSSLISGIFKGLSKAFNFLTSLLGNIFKEQGLYGLLKTAGKIGIAGLLAKFVISIISALKIFSKVGRVFDSLRDVFYGIEKYFKAKIFEAFGNGVKAFAIAIGLLTLSLYALGNMDPNTAIQGTLCIVALIGIMWLFKKLVATSSGINLMAASAAFLGFSIAIGILSIGVFALGSMSNSTLAKGIIAIGLLTLIFGLFRALVGKAVGINLIAVVAAFTIFSVSIDILAIGVRALGKLSVGQLAKGIIAIGLLTLIFGLFRKLVGSAVGINLIAVAGAFTVFSVSIDILSIGVKALGSLSVAELAKGIIAIGLLTLIFGLFRALVGKAVGINLIAVVAAFTIFSVSIDILSIGVKALGSLSVAELAKGIIAIGLLTLIFGLFRALVGKAVGINLIAVVAAFTIFSVSIDILAIGVRALGKLSVGQLAKGIIAITLLTFIFAILASIPSINFSSILGFIAFSAAVLIVSAALNELIPVIDKIVSLGKDWWKPLVFLAGALGAILIAGAVSSVGPVAVGLAVFAGVILSIGLACLLAGVGIGIAAAAIALLISSFANLVDVVAKEGPRFAENFGTVLKAILEAVIELAPLFAVAGQVLITALAIGIARSAGAIAAAGALLVLEFMDAFLTILSEFGPKAVYGIISAINNLADAIRDSAPLLVLAAQNLMEALIEAILIGIAGLVEPFGGVGKKIAEKITSWIPGLRNLFNVAGEEASDSFDSGFSGGGGGHRFGNSEEAASAAKSDYDAYENSLVDAGDVGSLVKSDEAAAAAAGEKDGEAYYNALLSKYGITDTTKAATTGSQSELSSNANDLISSLLSGDASIPGLDNGILDFSKLLGIESLDMSSFTSMFSGAIGENGALDFGKILGIESFDMSSLTSMFSGSIGENGALDLSKMLGIESVDVSSLTSMFSGASDDVSSNLAAAMQTSTANDITPAAENMASAIKEPIVSIIGEAYNWGEDLSNNFASGIRAGEDAVMLSASYIAEIVHAILGFSEPEKGPLSDFHTYAPDMIKLWNQGIYDNIGSVRESSYSVADSVYDGFSTALDYVSDLIDNGMSDQLTIRPIMDLSEIQNGMDSMSGMISSADGYQITGTTKLAASAAYGIGVKPEVQQTPQPELVEAGAINNTFYITNNDPNAVAEKVSKIISGQVRRQKAVWAR